MVVFYEFLGLASIATQIKKLWWTKVEYNSTWEVKINNLYHSWKNLDFPQVKNDFYLTEKQAFNIIEGSTMGWKSFNIESIHLIIRASQSIWFVPASFASLPIFDWVIFIDRILEDEKNKLSAGQNDAKAWKIILEKVKNKISEQSKSWKYWFSIDEMLSSVPARYQEWFIFSILEELTALWQKWQLAIHNPELVSKLQEINSEAYTITHPEVIVENWDITYTYKIKEWRSLDEKWEISAYSIETARKLGLKEEILKLVKNFKQEEKLY
jgi:dsDNA-specific endonuclease/ATPase MutS2